MDKELNLINILKDCPIGTPLYSPLFGDVRLHYIGQSTVTVKLSDIKTAHFLSNGKYFSDNPECMLFPSKENRDWSNFHPNGHKFQPRDWCLMRNIKERFPYTWRLCQFAYKTDDGLYEAVGGHRYKECLPYNNLTKHLLGTALDYK